MKKKLFLVLMLLYSVIGLCACSAKVNEDNQNTNPQERYTKEDKTERVSTDEGKESSIENKNEKTEDSSTDDLGSPASDVTLVENRIIQDQSFDVKLNDWGNVRFISYEPDNSNDFEDVSFFLMKNNSVIYSFPYYCENNSTENYVGLYDSVAAVGFCDVNKDNIKDVIVIINYITGAGPQGMVPRPRARIFLADKKEFNLANDLIDDITNNIEEKDLTISAICNYLKEK
ncbi:hypothetical protein [Anaerocolumna sp. MB42-C2]|uniref:hypothetical protein n=1 Tax=Anaerocolumna sp. MB42-C2 TaxID=3070997 RepID=UPI0027DFB36E|nr:hypothetical protein [Anaerocolumna sp. MB42-C2]WMJ90106.1 hypothetical protein RBU59_11440 [Anaerocolumna sp. MB42-C2]